MQSGAVYFHQRDASPGARGGGRRSGRGHGEPPTTPVGVYPSAYTLGTGAQGTPSQLASSSLSRAERV
jgi:hypothetical protein